MLNHRWGLSLAVGLCVACGSSTDVDCDGEVVLSYFDGDGDGFGDPASELIECGTVGAGRTRDARDCDDSDRLIFPGATEQCNGLDDDCNDTIDDGLPTTPAYRDVDGDGEGDANDAIDVCGALPEGYVANSDDCDDTNDRIFSSAAEVCDGIDNDCDTRVDANDANIRQNSLIDLYDDDDGDGFGAAFVSRACEVAPGTAAVAGDCDDADFDVNPGAVEICSGLDDDCDTLVDEEDGSLDLSTLIVFFLDDDGDGLGNPLISVSTCALPVGHAEEGTDCDDASFAIRDTREWVEDLDGDGVGAGPITEAGCVPPTAAHVVWTGQPDCNESDAAVYPGATEVCGDSTDSDCDGFDDVVAYRDADGDGFGRDSTVVPACGAVPDGFVLVAGDCDDDSDLRFPGAKETCNDLDDDCDGLLGPEESTDFDGDGVVACDDFDDTDASIGPQICYDFDEVDWTYHRTGSAFPVATSTNEVTLTQDNINSIGGAVMLQPTWAPPYTLSMEVSIFDDDGSDFALFNSADGIAVMFAKDTSVYGTPPVGGTRGVIVTDGTGYSVHLQTFSSREIRLHDGSGSLLASVLQPAVYTHGDWVPLEIDVATDSVSVVFDGVPELTWTGVVSDAFSGIGVSAATGGSDSEHLVRDFCVTQRL